MTQFLNLNDTLKAKEKMSIDNEVSTTVVEVYRGSTISFHDKYFRSCSSKKRINLQ
jgi:hypothetical protein